MTGRGGHSLVELIVAMTFMGSAFAGISATALLGARWTAAAGARAEMVAVAASALDSILADSTPPLAGAGDRQRVHLRWAVARDSAATRVTVDAGTEAPALSLRLEGVWAPSPPVLVLP